MCALFFSVMLHKEVDRFECSLQTQYPYCYGCHPWQPVARYQIYQLLLKHYYFFLINDLAGLTTKRFRIALLPNNIRKSMVSRSVSVISIDHVWSPKITGV